MGGATQCLTGTGVELTHAWLRLICGGLELASLGRPVAKMLGSHHFKVPLLHLVVRKL